jgi:hypothetical protein
MAKVFDDGFGGGRIFAAGVEFFNQGIAITYLPGSHHHGPPPMFSCPHQLLSMQLTCDH